MKNKEKKIKYFSCQEGLDRVSNSSNFSWNQQTNSSSKSTTKKHVLSGVLAFFVCFAIFAAVVFPLSSTSTDNTILGTAPEDLNDSWILEENRGTSFAGGSGTEDDPFQIETAEQLAYLSYLVYSGTANEDYINGNYYFSGVYFKQTANIDLSAHYWQPIGIYYNRAAETQRHYFSGNYDGDGYTVSGIYTPEGSDNAYSYQGLFGYVYGRSSSNRATITNVGVIDSDIRGYSNVGGIAGYARNTTITNCYNTGDVTGSGEDVGGIAGYAYSDTIIMNCYNTGSVTGSGEDVGGIAGSGTIITNCYNTGTVTGEGNYVGGISGSGSPTTSYNTGSVIGAGYVGGISGSGSPESCFNVGVVNGIGSNVVIMVVIAATLAA